MPSPPDSWLNRGPAEEPEFDEQAYEDYWADVHYQMQREGR